MGRRVLFTMMGVGALCAVAHAAATGSGAIKGKVTFAGTAPKARVVQVNADAHCKREHPNGLEQQTVKVKNGGLGNVFVNFFT